MLARLRAAIDREFARRADRNDLRRKLRDVRASNEQARRDSDEWERRARLAESLLASERRDRQTQGKG